MAKQTRSTGKFYAVNYDVTLHGSIVIEASSPAEAKRIVWDDVDINELIRIGQSGDFFREDDVKAYAAQGIKSPRPCQIAEGKQAVAA